MVIRLGKFEATLLCSLAVIVAFFFALSQENEVTKASANTQIAEVPVIMYHHITEDRGKTNKYTVHFSELLSDLDYLEENGYTTVTVSDLISFVDRKSELPENPVMITFDDGFESFYALAYPVFKERNMKAVVSVIGKVTEQYSENEDHNINYSNLNFTQISEMIESGFVEIQNHSYNMHASLPSGRKGISKLNSETYEEYNKNLSEDLLTLQKILKLNCGITPDCVAYPYGAYSNETLAVIKKLGFKSTMLCEERINTIVQGDKNSLYNLGRFNRASGVSTEAFFKNVMKTNLS